MQQKSGIHLKESNFLRGQFRRGVCVEEQVHAEHHLIYPRRRLLNLKAHCDQQQSSNEELPCCFTAVWRRTCGL